MLEWILYICTFVFFLPVNETKSKSQIEAGAIAIFIAWINFIWFFKQQPTFGIYVVLTNKVFQSLLKVKFYLDNINHSSLFWTTRQDARRWIIRDQGRADIHGILVFLICNIKAFYRIVYLLLQAFWYIFHTLNCGFA